MKDREIVFDDYTVLLTPKPELEKHPKRQSDWVYRVLFDDEIVGDKIAITEIASVYDEKLCNINRLIKRKGVECQARGKVPQSKMEQKIYDARKLRESIKSNILGMYEVNKIECESSHCSPC